MPDVVIQNPILNSSFEEPTRHFRFDDDGITNEVIEVRRVSSYFVPIPQAKKKGKKGAEQLTFDTEWTRDRIEENKLVNRIRQRVTHWSHAGMPGSYALSQQSPPRLRRHPGTSLLKCVSELSGQDAWPIIVGGVIFLS